MGGRELHVRRQGGEQVPAQARPGPDLQGAPGGGGRIRVLRKEAAGDGLLGAKLLRRVRQRGRHDERGRHADVLVPDPQAGREEGTLRKQPLSVLNASDSTYLISIQGSRTTKTRSTAPAPAPFD